MASPFHFDSHYEKCNKLTACLLPHPLPRQALTVGWEFSH
jgi:hypothetical protein